MKVEIQIIVCKVTMKTSLCMGYSILEQAPSIHTASFIGLAAQAALLLQQ